MEESKTYETGRDCTFSKRRGEVVLRWKGLDVFCCGGLVVGGVVVYSSRYGVADGFCVDRYFLIRLPGYDIRYDANLGSGESRIPSGCQVVSNANLA